MQVDTLVQVELVRKVADQVVLVLEEEEEEEGLDKVAEVVVSDY